MRKAVKREYWQELQHIPQRKLEELKPRYYKLFNKLYLILFGVIQRHSLKLDSHLPKLFLFLSMIAIQK